MRAQQQWTGSARISREPQIGGAESLAAATPPSARHDETLPDAARSAPAHELQPARTASSAEPASDLCASIEAITAEVMRIAAAPSERPTVVPPVDTTTDLPPNDSIRPIRNVELQRIVNGR
jgi:hypothetical protein